MMEDEENLSSEDITEDLVSMALENESDEASLQDPSEAPSTDLQPEGEESETTEEDERALNSSKEPISNEGANDGPETSPAEFLGGFNATSTPNLTFEDVSRLLKRVRERTIQYAMKVLRFIPTHQSTGLLTLAFAFMVILVSVAANTRAVISPFYQLNPIWIFFALVAYCFGFVFSNTITMKAKYLRSLSIMYFFIMVFFLVLFVNPNSTVFQEPSIRNLSGFVTLLFVSTFGGVICGEVAQSDSLGDSFFRVHVLPKLQSHNVPISLLHCDPSGEFRLIDAKSIDIHWNSNASELQLNGEPLSFFTPVFIQNRNLTCALQHWLDVLENQPHTRRQAMKHYPGTLQMGHDRFRAIYLAYVLGFHNPSAVAKSGQFVQLLRSKIIVETTTYTIQWPVPELSWSRMFHDGRSVLAQAFDPFARLRDAQVKITSKERSVVNDIMPEFCGPHEDYGIYLQRSLLHFLLAFRRGEFQSEYRMQIMQIVVQWALEYRRSPRPEFESHSPVRSVTIDEWERIDNVLETEGVSFFMRMYNWLNDLIDQYPEASETVMKIESVIEEGLASLRSQTEQRVTGLQDVAHLGGLHYDGASGLEKKIRLVATALSWVLFASTLVSPEELPI